MVKGMFKSWSVLPASIMAIDTFSTLSLLATAAATLVCYLSWTIIHRLHLSPISNFPGPRLAALTFWFVKFLYFLLFYP